ncbi:hypothetical protein PRIPAC_97619 [Pristionchus pacificus]|uniref:G protein-coupled receptor n=1 Tax=Pristionchus pacificus TaxID=54126 RepID=A0A2A6D1H2_PRIPA|nr:hypothetical protein PRIPAC_97619 [Pristionchus pacificus]|eukprot:PDM84230.1 G protein-coupled receptor [Pristionchus pacificus]
MVDLVGMKIIYLAVMFVITVVCGAVPVKLLQYIRARTNSMDRFTIILSILSCFAGGVFLGVALLDMLPEAFESFEDFKRAAEFDTDVPVVPIVIGGGFFFIYLFDLLPLSCGHAHSHDVAAVIQVYSPVSATPEDGDHAAKWAVPRATDGPPLLAAREALEGRAAYLKSLTFILSFLLHVALEGFVLGVQAFSIGTRLHQNHPTNTLFVIAMLVLVATVCTIGGVVGIVLKDASMSAAAKAGVETALTSVSIGTFLYITFFEILAVEKGTPGQRLAATIGFVVIGIPAIFLPSVTKMESECEFAVDLYYSTQLHALQWIHKHVRKSLFESSTKELIIALYVMCTFYAIFLAVAQILCIFRTMISATVPGFCVLHFGIAIQRFQSTFLIRNQAQNATARFFIALSVIYSCIFGYMSFHNEPLDGLTPYCVSFNKSSEQIIMLNLYVMTGIDMMSVSSTIALYRFNKFMLAKERAERILQKTFHRKQCIFAIEQFLPITIIHTTTYVMPYYCILAPFTLLMLIRKGRFEKASVLTGFASSAHQKVVNETYFRQLREQWS